jgi:glycosyltransferase involved in cell wall biosynthesis
MKLSVILLTYNHAPYVEQAVESILRQETDFPFEILAADDASTDGTADILRACSRRQPDKFRLLLNASNAGIPENFLSTIEKAAGEYVAILEGDDYWTHPGKLRRQVGFLDAHPAYALCGHNGMVRNEWADSMHVMRGNVPEDVDLPLSHLIRGNFIPTASIMYRRSLMGAWPDCFRALGFGDWPLQIILAQRGAVRFLAEPMSVYRIHSGGAWSSRYRKRDDPSAGPTAEAWHRVIEFWEILQSYLGAPYSEELSELIQHKREELAGIEAPAKYVDLRRVATGPGV